MVGQERWQEIHRLFREGWVPIAEISRRLDLDRKTVRRCLGQPTWQPYTGPVRAGTLLAGHVDWLRERAPQVQYSARILFQELRQHRGYRGSYDTVKLFVQPLRAVRQQAERALTPSVELNRDGSQIVDFLIHLGYSSFKFVNGETFRTAPPILDHELGWKLLRKLSRKIPGVGGVIRKLPQRLRNRSEFDEDGKYSPNGYRFSAHSSGPFGENACGSWLTPAQAMRWLGKTRGWGQDLWWDVHAKHPERLRQYGNVPDTGTPA